MKQAGISVENSNTIVSMTEHAGYVWPSYGVAALVLIGLVVVSLRAFRKSRAELERLEAQMPGKSDEA